MPSRRRAIRFLLPACLVSLLVFAGCNARQPPLLAGTPDFERRGQPDAAAAAGFAIDCGVGRGWVARLEQRSFDGQLELLDAQGRIRASVAGPARGGGHEMLFAAAAPAGTQRLRVVAERPPPAAARYLLQVYCLRAPSPAALDALRAMNAAGDPARSTDAARRDAAVAQYEAAAGAWARLGESELAAEVELQLAALHYFEREAWSPAIEAARRALAGLGADGPPPLRATARLLEGAALMEQARAGRASSSAAEGAAAGLAAHADDPWRGARDALGEAAALYRAEGLSIEAAEVDVYRAGLDYERGELDAAVAGFEAAGAALRAAGAEGAAAQVARNLAAVRFDRGDYRGALRDYEALLARFAGGRDSTRAYLLQNLAAAASASGLVERALVAYRESLDIGTSLGDLDVTARALAGLGVNHGRLGHRDLALTYLGDAVAQRRRQARPDALAQALAQLGNAQLEAGEPRLAAATQREAVALLGADAAPLLRARIELALGSAQLAAREYPAAIATLSAALARLPGPTNSVNARLLVARAAAFRERGELTAAAEDVARALAFAQESDDRETAVAAREQSARLALARGEAALALREATLAAGEIERLPVGATSPENRQSLRARLRSVFDLRVQLLAREALAAAERGERAQAQRRALEALRASADAGLPDDTAARRPAAAAGGGARTAGADIDGSSRGDDSTVYALLAARRDRYEALAERHAAPTPTMRSLEREIALLRTRLVTGPRGGAAPGRATRDDTISATVPAPVALPPEVGVLAFWLGPDRSWAWTLTKDGVALHPLPARARLEAGVTQLLRKVRQPDADAPATERARDSLQRLLLPPGTFPVGVRRLRIVPEGVLGALPWALLAPRGQVESMTLLTSAAALFEAPAVAAAPLRLSERVQDVPAGPSRVVLVGDPVFDADDGRLASRVRAAPRASQPGTEPDTRRLARLPGTAREIAAIARLAGDGVRLQATGLEATREAVLGLDAGSADVLHLATHAVIDTEVPELAALVLSRVDATGQPRPGRLRAHDILRLRGVPPLVVLSACDAAAEPGAAAAGRMNLASAFLHAGAHDVVGSLWEASDAATTELMTRFYEGLLRQRLDPETALARAQRSLATESRWRAPFFWAGFVLTRAAP